jgi:hypothetical protein
MLSRELQRKNKTIRFTRGTREAHLHVGASRNDQITTALPKRAGETYQYGKVFSAIPGFGVFIDESHEPFLLWIGEGFQALSVRRQLLNGAGNARGAC